MLERRIRDNRLVGRVRMALAAAVCGVVAVTSTTTGVQAAPSKPSPGAPLKAQAERINRHGRELHGIAAAMPKSRYTPPPAPVWPAAGTASVSLSGAGATSSLPGAGATPLAKAARPQAVRAGTLPVWIKPVAGQRQADVKVQVLDRAAVPAKWRDGMVTRISGAATAEVSVGYDSFRYAHGADWASRLALWQLPECAVSTPAKAGCAPRKLASANDVTTGRVTAAVAATGGLVALAAAADGPGGSFSATPLAESSTWSAGGSSGDFTWSYPMRVPPSAGGLEPDLGLSYSSSSVDGRSVATNNQPSWIGEGFEYSPGFIERKFINCVDDMDGAHNNAQRTGDQCWRSDNAILSLGGRSTELLRDAKGKWHGRTEDGSVITKAEGDSWKLVTTDGTQYFFGRDKLPVQAALTNSSWTTRVYGNHPGEPCYNADFAKSGCDQIWRWNLDYVVDVRGNTMSYWYDKEVNRYAANLKNTDLQSYVRGGTLRRIDYGTWERGANVSVIPRGQVIFDAGDRCKADCGQHTAAKWPDVPWDQECKADAKTCDNYSPSYWSTKRLAKVTTRVWDTTVTPQKWQDVDSWDLTPDFPSPSDGTNAGLWLASLVHTGLVGGQKAMPPVTFSPIPMANRVLAKHNRTDSWQRIGAIISETGAKTVVNYSLPECTEANTKDLKPQSNTMLCFPVIAPNPSDPKEPDVTEWWHKYVVRQVVQTDVALTDSHQSPIMNTYYTYGDTPAWHYTDDDGFIAKNRKTWSSFRGYDTVETRVGELSGPQTLTETRFFRGMNDDRATPGGGKRKVTVEASLGTEKVDDEDQFAGLVREQIVYNGAKNKPVSKTVNVPWRSEPTASRTINDDVAEARFLDNRVTYSATALGVDGSRGWRTTRTESTFDDADGTVKRSQGDGDIAVQGDEQCVTYAYAPKNVEANLVGLPRQVTTTALPCDKPAASTDDIVSDVRYSYDEAAVDTNPVPVRGEVTATERLKDWSAAGGTRFQVAGAVTYDNFGRPKTQTDIRGNTTTVTYEPADLPVAKVTSVTAKPYEWKTSIAQAPYWGAPTVTTDLLGGKTTTDYDPLGRVSKVWALGWAKAGHETRPSQSFEYNLSADRKSYPSVVSQTLNATGRYNVGYAIFDGLLRPRQNQARGANGNRVVTDTIYDLYGNATTSYPAHVVEGAPSGNLFWTPEWSLDHIQRTVFDLAGRPTAQITLTGDGVTNQVERWRTTTAYEGDLTKVTPPAGGVPTTTVTDAHDRVRQLRVHPTPAGVGGAFDATTYAYNRKNQLVQTVDPGGNTWSTTYDIRGRQKVQSDPDKGTTNLTYNDVDDVITTTDARGNTLLNKYDPLGRKIKLYEGADEATGKLRAEWKYDALYTHDSAKGQLTESIRYDNDRAFKQQVRQFDSRHQPVSINYVVPPAETGLGGTYVFGYESSAFNGAQQSVIYPAAGNLTTEQVTTRFDPDSGLPLKLETGLNTVFSYVTKQEYTGLGEPTVTFREINGGQYVQSSTEYDTYTRRVTREAVKPELAAAPVVDRKYDYDPTGNIMSLTDTPGVGDSEKQCFGYDGLRRLSSAWTPKTDAACATPAALGALAGPAPYWTDWTFDKLGNRRTEISHAATGDTTRTYSYPEPGVNVVRPHAVTTLKTSVNGSDVTVGFGYDAAGNMESRQVASGTQALSWDVENELSKVVDGGNTTGYLYGANGERLIRRDPSGTTVYLPGMEIKKPSGSTDVVATRHYSFAGRVIASRTGAGLEWLFTDHQGTELTSVNNSTQKVTVRRQTPYGASREKQPDPWVNNSGFVGGMAEPTGLTHLGARDYDPELGRFVSVDPLMDLTDPQQWNGYSYANNSPITSSDPTGLLTEDCSDHDCYGYTPDAPGHHGGCPGGCGTDKNVKWGQKNHKTSTRNKNYHAGNPAGGNSGRGNGPQAGKPHPDESKGEVWTPETFSLWFYDESLAVAQQHHAVLSDMCSKVGQFCELLSGSPGINPEAVIDGALALPLIVFAPEMLAACGAAVLACAAGYAEDTAAFYGSGSLVGSVGTRLLTPKSCSFTADTPVLLADQKEKPIADIRIGDEVLATDPATGVTVPSKVTALHKDLDHQLTDLSVVDATGLARTIRTTPNHPFWDGSSHRWTRADDLQSADLLLTPDGGSAHVRDVRTFAADSYMYNLTVENLHTYYVLAGTTPVLVHNAGCSGDRWTSGQNLDKHFDKHGEEVGLVTKSEYDYAARDLMCTCDGRRPGVQIKQDGSTRYFFDPESREFGMASDRGIVTYYEADQAYFNRQPGTLVP